MKLYLNIGMNTLYQLLGKFVTASVALISTRLMTGALGLEGYGEYQVIVTYVTLFWILTDFGLNSIAVREMAAHESETPKIFSSLVTIRILLGIALLAVSLVILQFMPYSTVIKEGIVFGSITTLLQSIAGSANGLFQVKLRYDQQLISSTVASVVSLSLLYITIQNNWGLNGFILAFISTAATMAVVNTILANRWVPYRLSHDIEFMKRIMKDTLPFGTALLFSLLLSKIDAMMLSVLQLNNLSNETAVGIYNLAYRVFELVLVFPVFFMNPVYPILVRHFNTSVTTFYRSIKKAALVLLAGAVGITSTLYVLAPYVIQALADAPGFDDSVTVLKILLVWTPLFFVTSLLMWILVTLNKQRALIIVYGIGFLFNLISNIFVIPVYTYLGAAWTTGVTELLICMLLIYYVVKGLHETKDAHGKVL